jgi:hypothetical protein
MLDGLKTYGVQITFKFVASAAEQLLVLPIQREIGQVEVIKSRNGPASIPMAFVATGSSELCFMNIKMTAAAGAFQSLILDHLIRSLMAGFTGHVAMFPLEREVSLLMIKAQFFPIGCLMAGFTPVVFRSVIFELRPMYSYMAGVTAV